MSGPTFGFIGVGTIASAIVRGLCTSRHDCQSTNPNCAHPLPSAIVLSPRSASRAAALQRDFPALVRVAASNQEVVDASDWVFLCVLPSLLAEVLGELVFRDGQQVVSVVAGVDNAVVEDLAGFPKGSVVRCLPLPSVATHSCFTLLYPPHAAATSMFHHLGTAVPVKHANEMNALQTITAMMGAYYALLHTCHRWLVGKGVDSESASVYVGGLMFGVAKDAMEVKGEGFEGLIAEQTPGGYNEQGIRELREAGVWEEVENTLGSLNRRFLGDAPQPRPSPKSSPSGRVPVAHVVVVAAVAAVVGFVVGRKF